MAIRLVPAELETFLSDRCGNTDGPALLARDVDSEIGWRPWTSEDSRALCEWLAEQSSSDDLPCYNLKEAAARVGISVPTMQTWLRRAEHPVPHVRDGRTIRIPAFLLREWLTEEARRCSTEQKRDGLVLKARPSS